MSTNKQPSKDLSEVKVESNENVARQQQITTKLNSLELLLNIINRIILKPNVTEYKIVDCKTITDPDCINSLCKCGFKKVKNQERLLFDDKCFKLLQTAKNEMQNMYDQLNIQLYFPKFTSNIQNTVIYEYNKAITNKKMHKYISLILNIYLIKKNETFFCGKTSVCDYCNGASPVFGNGCDGCGGFGLLKKQNDYKQKVPDINTAKHVLNVLRKAYKTNHDINNHRKKESNFNSNYKYQHARLRNSEDKILKNTYHGKGFIKCLSMCFSEETLNTYIQNIRCIDTNTITPMHGLKSAIAYFLINSVPAISSCLKLWNHETFQHGIDIQKCIMEEALKCNDSWIIQKQCNKTLVLHGWSVESWSESPICIPHEIVKKIKENPSMNIHLKTSVNKSVADLLSLVHNLCAYYPHNDLYSLELIWRIFENYPLLYLFILKGCTVLDEKAKELINKMKNKMALKQIEESQQILNHLKDNVRFLFPLIEGIVCDEDMFKSVNASRIPVLPLGNQVCEFYDPEAFSRSRKEKSNQFPNPEEKNDNDGNDDEDVTENTQRVTDFQKLQQIDIYSETGWTSGTICKIQDDKVLIHVPQQGPQWKKKTSSDIAPAGTYTDHWKM